MSRGFVKEEDQEETPLVPPRADLPAGLTNYVTAKGMEELEAEKESLLDELKNLASANEKERRISSNFIQAKLQLLQERIDSAQLVDLSQQKQDEVRFGAKVDILMGNSNQAQQYQIVGVDEADLKQKKLAFNSPLPRLLMGKKEGEIVVLKTPQGERDIEIKKISYVNS